MKSIYVPLNKQAQKRFAYYESVPGDLLELEIRNDIFDKLYASDFFENINQIADVIIDYFEEEEIEDADLLKKVIESNVFDPTSDDEINNALLEIKKMFIYALEKGTAIYFYF